MDDVARVPQGPEEDLVCLEERMVAKVRDAKSFAKAYETALNAGSYELGGGAIYAIPQEILDPLESVLISVFYALLKRATTADECRRCWNLAIARSNKTRILLEDLAYEKALLCAKNSEEREEIEKLIS